MQQKRFSSGLDAAFLSVEKKIPLAIVPAGLLDRLDILESVAPVFVSARQRSLF